MALLSTLGVGGTGTATAGGGTLLTVNLDPLLSLNVGAGGGTSLTGSSAAGTTAPTASSDLIHLGVDLGSGTFTTGSLLNGLLGGGSAGGGEGLIPGTIDLLTGTITNLTGMFVGTSGGGASGGVPTNPGTPGQSITGTEGPDLLRGTAGNDTISGLGGNDIIIGNGGNDIINGGAGRDTVVMNGAITTFTAAAQNGVLGLHSTTTGENTFLMSVERVNFQDHILALDFNGDAGQVFRLYQATFDRAPDTAGLTHNVQLVDNGTISLGPVVA